MFPAGNPAFLGPDVHKHDIRPDPANALPGNDEIIPSAGQSQQLSGSWNHDGHYMPLRYGNLHIGDKTQPPPVIDANDLLALKIRKLSSHAVASP